jgi:hypothetical protein
LAISTIATRRDTVVDSSQPQGAHAASRARNYNSYLDINLITVAALLPATLAASPEITAEVRRHAPRDQG